MKRGAYIVNTARAKICNRDAIVRARRADSSRVMRETYGFRNPLPTTIPGAPCHITG
jgi:formate dehydrogenase